MKWLCNKEKKIKRKLEKDKDIYLDIVNDIYINLLYDLFCLLFKNLVGVDLICLYNVVIFRYYYVFCLKRKGLWIIVKIIEIVVYKDD